eukprot:scaffold64301_cov53-Phaeocystis_antarctica.AAC.2
MSKTQPSSIIVPGFICESVVACWHNQHREPPASRCGVLGLQIWPTGSARGERPPRDLPCGVRIVDAGLELPGRAAPAR